jgi:hypothetical protein
MVDNTQNESCYGFGVRSGVEMRFMRQGGVREIIDVVEAPHPLPVPAGRALFEWRFRGADNTIKASLHEQGSEYLFWTADTGCYRIAPERRRIEIPAGANAIRREERLWGVPAMLCLIDRGDFPLHASAVEIDSGALLFAGPGGSGKTTLALGFHLEGYRILTEDMSCCDLASEPALLPGPTSLRVRPDVFPFQMPQGARVVLKEDERIHLLIERNRQGTSVPVPVRALCFLRESDDEIRFERVRPQDAIPDIWALSFRFQTDQELRRSFLRVVRLAGSIPLWNLYRPARLDRLGETINQIIETLG